MTAPFAALEKRINQAVTSHLANRVMLVDAVPVEGVFLDSYAEVGNIESSNPIFVVENRYLEHVAHGTVLVTVNGSSRYEVVGIRPDGDGMTILELHAEWHI